jgi:hypothetical protein
MVTRSRWGFEEDREKPLLRLRKTDMEQKDNQIEQSRLLVSEIHLYKLMLINNRLISFS